jgi:DNA-binding response OmpR family regulator
MDFNKIKVLVVDDELMMLDVILQFLKRHGFDPKNITLASNGAEAEKALNSKIFDLVISDFEYLPFNGLELFEKIRAGEYLEENRYVPFLLMSGRSYEYIVGLGFYLFPLFHYIQKPFSSLVILNEIRDILFIRGGGSRW